MNRRAKENRKKTAGVRVRVVSPVGGNVGELWREGFMEKMSFEPAVEDRRSNE